MKSLLIASFFIANMFMSIVSKAQLSDALMLTVSSGPYSDQTAIRFLDVATDYFDSDWDAYKLRNLCNTPNFCSQINGQTYSINALNGYGSSINQTVPLSLEVGFSGTYTITAEEIGLFDTSCTITLIDKLRGEEQDLKTTKSYTFEFQVGDPADRFCLVFKTPVVKIDIGTFLSTSVDHATDDNGLKIYNNGGNIVVEFEHAQSSPQVQINDMSGNAIAHSTIDRKNAAKTIWTHAPIKTNLYIVSVVLDGKLYAEKVYVQP